METAIYLTEVAGGFGDAWIDNELREENADFNGGLPRTALKMATGTGKTVVMAMLIAWQALNKLEDRHDKRFSDAFLIVAPGITIRDRLRVLLPQDPSNYYRERDLVPADLVERLGQARVVITNYHAFLLRERGGAAKLTKAILAKGAPSPFTETPDQMVRRVCRELGTRKQIVVLNDEAHHCYRGLARGDGEKLTGEDRVEAKQREEEARVWMSGLEAVHRKLGIRSVYDLSATPFFLRGSGYPEGTLFPWVTSDFSLIDAIESGIVKVPRVPVDSNAMTGEMPTYRDLWLRIRDDLPKKGRRGETRDGPPVLPAELEGALHSLYGHYRQQFERWQSDAARQAAGATPPVFVVVCNNTSVSKLVFDYVAGWSRTLADGTTVAVPGQLPLFSNVDDDRWSSRPTSILVDSQQLESGEAMSDEFKRMAATEIEEFKAEYRQRFPGRDAEALTDEDLLREVMNTVGKAGKLGEHVRCVVSVSMLTEGWDANTVTHILGVRAFGTQLLCEQVVGRGLRRMSYAVNDDGRFSPEYAEVYGVPFSFIPTSGTGAAPQPGPPHTRVRALEERAGCEITFPRLTGYRFDTPTDRLSATFSDDAKLAISTADIPTHTVNAPIVGELAVHTLDDLRARRPAEIPFALAKLVSEKYYADRPFVFPQVLAIAKRWVAECLTLKNAPDTFPQLLLLSEFAHDAADRIYRAIVVAHDPPSPGGFGAAGPSAPESTSGAGLKPLLRAHDPLGTTRWVDFDTTKPTMTTDPGKCHVSHVVADTGSWEQKMAQVLEELDEVTCYVKNQGLNFTIPYTLAGESRQYVPDFIVRAKPDLNLIVEVSGEAKKDKAAKVATARALWVPAVNNHGGFGRWTFVEVTDPWDAKGVVTAAIADAMALV